MKLAILRLIKCSCIVDFNFIQCYTIYFCLKTRFAWSIYSSAIIRYEYLHPFWRFSPRYNIQQNSVYNAPGLTSGYCACSFHSIDLFLDHICHFQHFSHCNLFSTFWFCKPLAIHHVDRCICAHYMDPHKIIKIKRLVHFNIRSHRIFGGPMPNELLFNTNAKNVHCDLPKKINMRSHHSIHVFLRVEEHCSFISRL